MWSKGDCLEWLLRIWRWFTGKEKLTAALSKMDVCYERDVLLSACIAPAVIRLCVRHAPNVVVIISL